MDIYLLRHGETEWNRAGRLQGRTDIPLNETGRMQMDHAGEVLKQLGVRMNLILASPLSRAQESAGIVARKLGYSQDEIVAEEMLLERCFGAGEGLTGAERKEKYPDDIFPDMEPVGEIRQRARGMIHKITDTYGNRENILLVAHGAIFYAVMAALGDGHFAYIGKSIILDQGNIYRIRYTKGRIGVSRYDGGRKVFEEIDNYEGSQLTHTVEDGENPGKETAWDGKRLFREA